MRTHGFASADDVARVIQGIRAVEYAKRSDPTGFGPVPGGTGLAACMVEVTSNSKDAYGYYPCTVKQLDIDPGTSAFTWADLDGGTDGLCIGINSGKLKKDQRYFGFNVEVYDGNSIIVVQDEVFKPYPLTEPCVLITRSSGYMTDIKFRQVWVLNAAGDTECREWDECCDSVGEVVVDACDVGVYTVLEVYVQIAGTGVEGRNVTVLGATTATDAGGLATFTGVPSGSISITVDSAGGGETATWVSNPYGGGSTSGSGYTATNTETACQTSTTTFTLTP